MSKRLVILLVFMISVTLCGCNTNMQSEDPTYTEPPTEEVLIIVPAPTFSSAEEQAATTPPTYKAVKITLDNWDTYFELSDDYGVWWNDNALGEATFFQLSKSLRLRDEYANRVNFYMSSGVSGAVEFSYEIGSRTLEVDLENHHYTICDDFQVSASGREVTQFNCIATNAQITSTLLVFKSFPKFLHEGNYRYSSFIDNVEISNIEYTLYVLSE